MGDAITTPFDVVLFLSIPCLLMAIPLAPIFFLMIRAERRRRRHKVQYDHSEHWPEMDEIDSGC